MMKTRKLLVCLASVLGSSLASGAASALDHSWVSSAGIGTACTRVSPCATFGAALAVTSPGGIVSVLDSGDFGNNAFINASVTIRAESVDAGTTFIAGGGFEIKAQIASSDTVILEGLHFAGGAIQIVSGGTLLVRNCVVQNDIPSSGSVGGIQISPSGGNAKVVISDSVVQNNGSSSGGAGILIMPGSGGSAQVTINRVIAQGNLFGIAVDGSNSTAGVNVTVSDSVLASNANDGLVATTSPSGAPIGVMLKNVKSTNNGFGVRSIGPTVTVRVDSSTIVGNGTGVAALSGGALLSFGNNAVRTNGTDGAFSGPVALQ